MTTRLPPAASRFLITAPRGTVPLLMAELRTLGVFNARRDRHGVLFDAPLAAGLRVSLWSRIGSRLILILKRLEAPSAEALQTGIRAIDWQEHLSPDESMRVDFLGTNDQIRHTLFGAQTVKDAVVDVLRDHYGSRPSVDTEQPDVCIHVRLLDQEALVGIDLCSDGLHQRGYRLHAGPAPLRENLAAAMLWAAGWPAMARAGAPFVDPMCGSGTLPIEAAMIAGDVAPGILRDPERLLRWRGAPSYVWRDLVTEAEERRQAALSHRTSAGGAAAILGYDLDERSVRNARMHATRAGVDAWIRFETQPLARLVTAPPISWVGTAQPGLLVTNPPHGHRLADSRTDGSAHDELHRLLTDPRWNSWRAAVLACTPQPVHTMAGTPWRAGPALHNGPLPCQLWQTGQPPEPAPDALMPPRPLPERRGGTPPVPALRKPPVSTAIPAPAPALTVLDVPPAEDFANRLRKNMRLLRRWLTQEEITCYRLYDSDMPEYAVAIDIYGEHAHVQEYQAPATVSPEQARYRLHQVLRTLPTVLAIPPEQIHLKVRAPQKGARQYQKQATPQRTMVDVVENGFRFAVNLTDYIDTGLFLDHRRVRQMIRNLAPGRSFLNLFGYTGTATVYAAGGGATRTTTVDLSHTYLDWAQHNMALNGLIPARRPDWNPPVSGRVPEMVHGRHRFIQADCLGWLDYESASPTRTRYDLILLDPPTFSNSKRMSGALDLQRDYGTLIAKTAALLNLGGVLIFSCNFAKFKLDRAALPGALSVVDVSRETSSPDFQRSTGRRYCWRMETMA